MVDAGGDESDDRHYEALVSLRIWRTQIDPNIITQTLGLDPDGAFRKGDQHRTRDGRTTSRIYDETFWNKRISEAWYPPTNLSDQLARTVTELERNAAFLRSLRDEGAHIEFFVGWFFRRNSGDVIGHALMERLGRLGIDLSFDVYDDSD